MAVDVSGCAAGDDASRKIPARFFLPGERQKLPKVAAGGIRSCGEAADLREFAGVWSLLEVIIPGWILAGRR